VVVVVVMVVVVVVVVVAVEEVAEATTAMEEDGPETTATDGQARMEAHLGEGPLEDHPEEDHPEEDHQEEAPPWGQQEATPRYEDFTSIPNSRHSKSPNSTDLTRSSKRGPTRAIAIGSSARRSPCFEYNLRRRPH
jgi:hypothetical protein